LKKIVADHREGALVPRLAVQQPLTYHHTEGNSNPSP